MAFCQRLAHSMGACLGRTYPGWADWRILGDAHKACSCLWSPAVAGGKSWLCCWGSRGPAALCGARHVSGPGVYLECAWSVPGAGLESAWGRPGTVLESAWSLESAWRWPGAGLELTWSSPGAGLEAARSQAAWGLPSVTPLLAAARIVDGLRSNRCVGKLELGT